MTLQLLHSKFSYIWGKIDFLFYQCRKVESGEAVHAAKMNAQIFMFSVATNTLWLADLYKFRFYFRNRQATTFLCPSDSLFCYVFFILSDTGWGGVPAGPEMVVPWWPLLSVSLTTLLVTLTYNSSMISNPRYRMRRSACGTGNGGASCSPPCSPLLSISLTTLLVILTHPSSMISISRYRMRRSVCGTGNGGAMMTFAIGFTDNLSCNSDLQFFYAFYSQIPDEEECLRDRKWWSHDDYCHRFHWQPFL